ncbi:retrovirus-related pol polyprotein from transposon RE1 [Tanacetum coccineum]|uniref:Retrovirus-related pol polyprotein from transposon RE1 n=1 Tax=Tanacetum coccineum TaxID=301880 RepID=A0ABQ5AUD6_9ASTR
MSCYFSSHQIMLIFVFLAAAFFHICGTIYRISLLLEVFDESSFPFSGVSSTLPPAQLLISTFSDGHSSTISSPTAPSTNQTQQPISTSSCGLCRDDPISTTLPFIDTQPTTSAAPQPPAAMPAATSPAPASSSPTDHPMVTRSKVGTFKSKHRAYLTYVSSSPLHHALFASAEPKGFKSAAKNPKCSNVVGSKWVFGTKFQADGSVDHFKARLVAQGFTQVSGLDYTAIFSLVVKASTVRIILSLPVLHKCPLHRLDVKNAFLNDNLTDTVFMEQPSGFIDTRFPNHVCRLKKALYGRADTSLFIFKRDSSLLYLLVYVDDIILTGNDAPSIRSFISHLNKEFSITNLGRLNYFLGLEPVAVPLSTSEYFTTKGTPFADPTLYRSLVGALQYLTITRPGLSYAVNQVSQFLHAPIKDHFLAVKRILRYVKGTLSYGLSFHHAYSPTILGYSDDDWARCIETRRSTYGYSIFLGGNLVS